MIGAIIRRLTGRSYTIGRGDLPYLLSKAAWPLLRGTAWSVMRLRNPRWLLLGSHTQFVQSGRLRLGRSVAIGAFSYIECGAREGVFLGDRVTIRERAWIQCRSGLNEPAAGVAIGPHTYIGPNMVLGAGGAVAIGRNVQIGANFTVSAESHLAGPSGDFTSGHVERRGITVGDDCWFGNNVTVLDGVTIGDGCVLGAGSVVTRSIPSHTLALGVPARPVRSLKTGTRLD